MLAWQYDRIELARSGAILPNPDYELATLPWQTAHPHVFDVTDGRMTLVTNAEPFAYQAFAILDRNGARGVDVQFDATIESGGATVGLLQDGKWIASSSSHSEAARKCDEPPVPYQKPGRVGFTGGAPTMIGSRR